MDGKAGGRRNHQRRARDGMYNPIRRGTARPGALTTIPARTLYGQECEILRGRRVAGATWSLVLRRLQMEGIVALLIPFAFFATCVLIYWLFARMRQHRNEKQADIQQQMLVKFESAGELAEFLATESGRQFMRQFEPNSYRMILATLSVGVIFGFLGLGFLGLTLLSEEDFLYPGVILLVLGLGFAAAAAVSKHLSAQWEKESRNGY
ncbi:MAG: hypothetical protein OXI13_10725 [Gammaproteobacteria bacterium]|nr:hypothetical protein [Gammaproteobacteria bacterium]